MGGVGEDLQEVLRRGFAGLHPRHDAARNQAGWGWVQSQKVLVGRRGSIIEMQKGGTVSKEVVVVA